VFYQIPGSSNFDLSISVPPLVTSFTSLLNLGATTIIWKDKTQQTIIVTESTAQVVREVPLSKFLHTSILTYLHTYYFLPLLNIWSDNIPVFYIYIVFFCFLSDVVPNILIGTLNSPGSSFGNH
jgi:hypothetical protein